MNYTKGKWNWMGTLNGKDIVIYQMQDNKQKDTLAINGGKGYIATIHTDYIGVSLAENESTANIRANARLIAACPDMLEMLKTVYTQLGEDMIDNNIPDKIYDLWAKYHNDIFDLLNKIEGGEK